MTELEANAIKEFILAHPDSKVYLGADSQRMRKRKVKFVTTVVVHYNNNNGAKVFADVSIEKVTDAKLSRPFNRLFTEVQKLTDVYTMLEEVLIDRDFEIHLDISPNEMNGSNVAHGAAKGMIMGMVGVEPVFKPEAWCASCVADKFSK